MDCKYENCLTKAKFGCFCKEIEVRLCDVHANTHCLLQGTHKLCPLYTHLDDQSKHKFIKKLREKIDAFDILVHKISQKSYSLLRAIIKTTESAVSKLKEQQRNLINKCLSAMKNSEVLVKDYKEYQEVEDYNFVLMFELENQLESRIEDYFSVDFSMSIKLEPAPEASELNKSFVFFEKNSRTLNVFDLLDMTGGASTVNLEDSFGDKAGWCRLPGRKIFQCGGQLSTLYPPLSASYIIDVDTRTVSSKPEGPWRKYAVGVCSYLEPFVYVFGGAGLFGSLLSESEKFDLLNETWTSISPLPLPSDYNSSIVKNPFIYITGYQIGLYKYKIDTDQYSSSFDLFVASKVLIEDNGLVFILCEKGVFLVQERNLIRSKKQSLIKEEAVLTSYPVKKGNSVYFLMSDGYLFKFNLTTLDIERLTLLGYN